MKIQILGGGWYGCHMAVALLERGYEIELHEIADTLFAGASGGNPARLHLGFHYPRSRLTRAMCQETHREFMARYQELTRTIPCNVYAVAANRSLVDLGNYVQTLRGEVDFIELEVPEELGLRNIEGAVLTGERHMIIDAARQYFMDRIGHCVQFGSRGPGKTSDWTIDCTFCARDGAGVERYEVCVTGLLRGPTDRAVTIMDGPFPSIYPWDEEKGLLTITSALHTPLHRVPTYDEALRLSQQVTGEQIYAAIGRMRLQMAEFWPDSYSLFEAVEGLVRIRAMPLSASDARLVDVIKIADRTLRIRAGKIDAIMRAQRLVEEFLCSA